MCATCLTGAKVQNEQDREKRREDCKVLGHWAENACAFPSPSLPVARATRTKRGLLYSGYKDQEVEVSSGLATICLVTE